MVLIVNDKLDLLVRMSGRLGGSAIFFALQHRTYVRCLFILEYRGGGVLSGSNWSISRFK